MQANLLANKSYYRTDYRKLNNKKDVIRLFKEFLKSNVNANEKQFDKIFNNLESNHEIRFDNSNENINLHGNTGPRIAYGAFRHEAIVHSVQTVWTYTFEIIKTDTGLYLSTDNWGWLPKNNLSERVSTHLE